MAEWIELGRTSTEEESDEGASCGGIASGNIDNGGNEASAEASLERVPLDLPVTADSLHNVRT